MVRSVVRRRTASRQNLTDLNLLLALMGMPIVLMLYSLLQSSNPNWPDHLSKLFPIFPNQSPKQPNPTVSNVIVLQPTHLAICQKGNDGLNIRPSASFATPIAVIPCNGPVAVNGAPVWKDGESWSPVVYGNVRGWSVSRLLQKR